MVKMELIKVLAWGVFYRRYISPLIYWIIRKTIHSDELPDVWGSIKDFSMDAFSDFINNFPYKADPLGGFIDYTIQEPDYFFLDLKFGRDCSDFASMWFWWAKERKYPVWKILLYDKGRLKSGHATCVFLKDGKYYLADYSIRGKYDTLEEAMEQFRVRELVAYGKYERLKWRVYQEWNSKS